MSTSMENFPMAMLADGIISYIQFLFSSPSHTPSEYRWNKNDRESRITISGPFVIDNERPNSAPFIIVERTQLNVDDRIIDNIKSSEANVFTPDEGVMVVNGGINITIGSQSATEASNIANYLAIEIQAARKHIMATLGFLRNLKVTSISPESPAFKDSEIKRWQVSMSLMVSLQLGWIKEIEDGDKWERFSVRAIRIPAEYNSTSGIMMDGSDTISDSTAKFGYTTDSLPQLLRAEFDNGWYSVSFDDGKTIHVVSEIVNDTTLKLKDFKSDGSHSGIKYKLQWNDVHLHIEQ